MINELIGEGVTVLRGALEVQAAGNLAAGLMSEAAAIENVALLNPLQERFTAVGRDRGLGRRADVSGRERGHGPVHGRARGGAVLTRTRVTFHSQTCYRFRPVGGAIREISAKVIGSR